MADIIREVPRQETVVNNSPATASAATATAPDRLTQLVYLLVVIVEILLAFRFVLRLLGASQTSPFVDFVYALSYPFVAPFFGVFNTVLSYGAARLETETLVAMAVYAVLGYIILAIIKVVQGRRIDEPS